MRSLWVIADLQLQALLHVQRFNCGPFRNLCLIAGFNCVWLTGPISGLQGPYLAYSPFCMAYSSAIKPRN